MKKIKYILLAVCCALFMLKACDLDPGVELLTSLQEEDVATQYVYQRQRATSMYLDLPSGFMEIDGAMMASATDEAEHTIQSSNIHLFNQGSWNAFNNPDDAWAGLFRAIRNVNLFLRDSDNVDLEMYRLNPRADYQLIYAERKANLKNWKNEALFLRAYYYFELIKRYGGVPIIEEILVPGDDYLKYNRNTLEECIAYIIAGCDSAVANLPIAQTDGELGRASGAAALALKAKVLLYAASELWNDPSWAAGYTKPELISLPPGNRMERWQAAADAAKEVIDLGSAVVRIHPIYQDIFLAPESFRNREHIFVRRHGASNQFERTNYSVGFDFGNSGTTPSQNLVDAYDVKVSNSVAEPFDWNNPDHASDPYASTGPTARDPRLFYNIIVNNSEFKGRNMQIWEGGIDGKGTVQSTRTGYYLKKFVDPNLNLTLNNTSVKAWSLIRLADIYLMYAEALNEYAPGHADIARYVNFVRQRPPSVRMPRIPTGLDQDEVREFIRRERRVELAFEGHRFWDVRRWMIAPEVLGVPLRGIEITRESADPPEFKYNLITMEERVFEPRMYFYPIPQKELLLMPNWIQNPMW